MLQKLKLLTGFSLKLYTHVERDENGLVRTPGNEDASKNWFGLEEFNCFDLQNPKLLLIEMQTLGCQT